MHTRNKSSAHQPASWVLLSFVALAVSACSSTPKTLKAPCGPTAGMTDPCGDREPINAALGEGLAFTDMVTLAREL